MVGTFRPPRYDYRGARYGDLLVQWLNEPFKRESKKPTKSVKDVGRERVSALIEAMKHLNNIASSPERLRDVVQVVINDLLKYHAEHLVVFVNDRGDIVVESQPADQVVVGGKIKAGAAEEERRAVNAVKLLTSMHLLDRVRLCQCGCRRWLYQTRTGKRAEIFYEEACRKKYQAHPRREVA